MFVCMCKSICTVEIQYIGVEIGANHHIRSIKHTHTHTHTRERKRERSNTHSYTHTQRERLIWHQPLTRSLDKGHVEVKGQQWLSQVLAEVALHSACNSFCVPLHLIRQVNGIQFAPLNTVFDQFSGLGEDSWFPVDSFLIQT